MLSCGTSGVSPRRGRGIDIGHCSIIFSAWQHCQAGSLPSYPVSCCCGQLRTDREYPAVHPGGFFHTPGLQSTPGVILYPAPSGKYPAPEKSPGVYRKGCGEHSACTDVCGLPFYTQSIGRRCAAWAIRATQTVSCGASIAHG
nr:MAG TPA: hypothetical protein [Caudoviricetes sp.]